MDATRRKPEPDGHAARLRRVAAPRARRGAAATVAVLMAVCLGWQTASAQPGDVINREYPLKALFLYNFGSYVEWPPEAFASPDQPFVIGILGAPALENTLREIAQTKTVQGRRLVVERYAGPAAIRPCQILFIGRQVTPAERQLAVDRLRQAPVLIVGETEGFAHRGGAINFFVENNKIRFEINLGTAREHALKISSKLLALARIVDAAGAAR